MEKKIDLEAKMISKLSDASDEYLEELQKFTKEIALELRKIHDKTSQSLFFTALDLAHSRLLKACVKEEYLAGIYKNLATTWTLRAEQLKKE